MPTTLGQAHSFYRTGSLSSIWVGFVEGLPPPAARPSEARLPFPHPSPPRSAEESALGQECPTHITGPTPQTLSASTPPPPASSPRKPSPASPTADIPVRLGPPPTPSRPPGTKARLNQPPPQSEASPQPAAFSSAPPPAPSA